MKIEKCSAPATEPSQKHDLTYEEILGEEGIYRLTNNSEGRVVVLKDGSNVTAFYISPFGEAEPCIGVKGSTFIKMNNARLCLEIR